MATIPRLTWSIAEGADEDQGYKAVAIGELTTSRKVEIGRISIWDGEIS